MIKLAINGYGRIGRNVLRALHERSDKNAIQIVAINDLGDPKINAHLTKYDTVHGTFQATVDHNDTSLIVDGQEIKTYSDTNPENLPWKELEVDAVLECTGVFRTKEKCQAHIKAGAKKVLLSAPGKNMDATVVYGVNHDIMNSGMTVISNASCTTNCLAPVVNIVNNHLGIESGVMTTIHAYTNDQRLNDVYHTDVYRARAAAQNLIPTKTGAAEAVALVIPEVKGKLSGMAVRVPVTNLSLIDFAFISKQQTSVHEINEIMENEAKNPDLSNVFMVNKAPLVSSDFNGSPYSSIFDATQTKVQGRLVKIMAWYDNEWGFCHRMLDTVMALFKS